MLSWLQGGEEGAGYPAERGEFGLGVLTDSTFYSGVLVFVSHGVVVVNSNFPLSFLFNIYSIASLNGKKIVICAFEQR